MPKNVAIAPKKPEFSLIDENLLKSRIYTIRGVQVMLDAGLAEIPGVGHYSFLENPVLFNAIISSFLKL